MCVVDASALAAVLFGEDEAELVEARIGSAVLAAPPLIHFEIANVAVKKISQKPESRDLIVTSVGRFEELGLVEVPVTASHLVALAERTGLTAYDAAYLHAAILLEVPLITLDKKLAAKARRHLPKKD
jgi:predicted nucleic acid-binding protein